MVTIKKGTEHTEEFQPKPDEEAEREADEDIKHGRFKTFNTAEDLIRDLNEPKPDQSGLLTAEETGVIYQRVNAKYDDAGEILHEYHKALLKAQRDLTASIKDAECQARIEALIEFLGVYENESVRLATIFRIWASDFKAKYTGR